MSRGRYFAIRLIIIGFLILIFAFPTKLVEGLVVERSFRQQAAVKDISAKWGDSQVLGGPILVVPYHPYGGTAPRTPYAESQMRLAYFVPEQLKITGDVKSQIRARGIYKVPVYESDLKIEGKFVGPDLAGASLTADKMYWDKAYLTIGGLDLAGLQSQITLSWAGQQKSFVAGSKSKLFASEVTIPVGLSSEGGRKTYPFSVALKVRGSGNLFFLPLGKETTVTLTSDWPSPSFDGAFLPATHTVHDQGFQATWQIFDLNRALRHSWTDAQNTSFGTVVENIKNLGSRRDPYYARDSYDDGYTKTVYTQGEFGVRLYQPVDIYQKTTRSAKYAMAIIGLVFLIYFLVEAAAKRRVNPLQYILVGLALCIFYTLLLSISEYISFGFAYLIASVAVVGMIGLFTKSILHNTHLGIVAGGVLVFLYGFIYILLQSKDYTLLVGSIGLFIILAILMYFSRYVNWYAEDDTAASSESRP